MIVDLVVEINVLILKSIEDALSSDLNDNNNLVSAITDINGITRSFHVELAKLLYLYNDAFIYVNGGLITNTELSITLGNISNREILISLSNKALIKNFYDRFRKHFHNLLALCMDKWATAPDAIAKYCMIGIFLSNLEIDCIRLEYCYMQVWEKRGISGNFGDA